ncbi:MAG: hypothetical protein JWP25_6066 [Bradyrhizobium sp.]|nr:hypothetical protein [Bradyrhizobium sp.]
MAPDLLNNLPNGIRAPPHGFTPVNASLEQLSFVGAGLLSRPESHFVDELTRQISTDYPQKSISCKYCNLARTHHVVVLYNRWLLGREIWLTFMKLTF